MSSATAHDSVLSVSSRIDALPGSPRLWLWIGVISVGGFFEVYDLALTGPLSSALVAAKIFRVGKSGLFGLADQATFIFTTFLGLYLGVLGFAAFGDRLGRRKVFAYSLIWYAAATFVLGLQSAVLPICFWRFVAGIGLGAEAVAIDCFLVELVPARLRGRTFAVSISIQYCAIPTAAFLAAVLVGHVPFGVAGWRWLTFLPVIGAVVFWAARRRLPESPRWLAGRGRTAEAHLVIDMLDRENRNGLGVPVRRPASVVAVGPGYVRRTVIMMLVYFNCQNIAYFGFANWVPTLLQSQGANLKDSLFYTAGVALAAPAAPLALALVADRLERKQLIIASGLFSVVAGLLFAWAHTPAGWVGFGVALAMCNSVLSANSHNYLGELFPTAVRARWSGFVYSFTRLTAAVSGFLIAYVLAHGGVKAVFIFLSALMGAAITAVALYGPRTTNITFEEDPQTG